MKLRDNLLVRHAQGSIVHQQIIRARAITAELKSNIEKSHQLTHTARNLITISRLILEDFQQRRHRNLTNH
jgi:hypothetical protein